MDLCSWTKKVDIYFGSMSRLAFILFVTSLLLSTLCEYLTNVTNAGIQSFTQSNSSSDCPAHLKYFLILVSPSFLVVSRSVLLIAYIYLPAKSTRFNAQATSAAAIVSAIPLNSPSFSLAFSIIIISFSTIILVWRMLCCQIYKSYSFIFVLL